MPYMEWRGHKLRLDPDGGELTMGQAKVIKRATGLRLVAFQKAVQAMIDSQDLDPELMQVFLWLLLDQNNVKTDIADLDDVPFAELVTAMASMVADEKPAERVDPTMADAPASGAPPDGSSNGYSTPTSTVAVTSTFSSLPTTAGSPL